MILTCPECSTRYLTKEDAIGPNGRTVRCTNCHATWFAASNADEFALKENQAETLTIAPDESKDDLKSDLNMREKGPSTIPLKPGPHVDIRNRADDRKRRKRLTSVGLIWAIPLALLSSTVVLGYVFRQNIVEAAPTSATLYKQLGVEVTLSGLIIEDPITRTIDIDGKTVLVVNGAVRNISRKRQDVPLIRLSLHGKSGAELTAWLVDTKKNQLDKKGRLTFLSEYPNPPLDAVLLKSKFADENGVGLTGAAESPHSFE